MAAVAPSADKASDLLQKLSLDSQPKKEESVDANKKTSSIPYGSVTEPKLKMARSSPTGH
jgi:hypothetical protein